MQKTSKFSVYEFPIEFEKDSLISFAKEPGLYYPPSNNTGRLHYHHSLEIGVCIEGSGIFYIGNRIFPFSAGDISVITPETVHIAQSRTVSPGGWKFFDLNLAQLGEAKDGAEIAEPFLNGDFKSAVFSKGTEPEILTLCQRILKEQQGKPKFYSTSVTALAVLLLVSLSRIKDDSPAFSAQPLDFEEIAPALFFLLQNYNKKVDVDTLCGLCNLSASSFRRKFNGAFGMSPSQYLYNIRIKAATGLLRTTLHPITEISEQVGYETLSSFLRHFSRIMGTNPTGYRRACLAGEGKQIGKSL